MNEPEFVRRSDGKECATCRCHIFYQRSDDSSLTPNEWLAPLKTRHVEEGLLSTKLVQREETPDCYHLHDVEVLDRILLQSTSSQSIDGETTSKIPCGSKSAELVKRDSSRTEQRNLHTRGLCGCAKHTGQLCGDDLWLAFDGMAFRSALNRARSCCCC